MWPGAGSVMRRFLFPADRHDVRAAGVEAAAGRRMQRARNVVGQPLAATSAAPRRVGGRHGGDQRLRIRVQRAGVQRALVGELDDLAEIHHGDPAGDVLHHAEVVGDEQIGEPEFALQVLQQVHDLRLHRDIQRRHRFVAHHEPRPQHQGAGDADALALAAGELVREPLAHAGGQADQFQHGSDVPAGLARPRARRGSAVAP